MKKKYIIPSVEIIQVEFQNIICTSGEFERLDNNVSVDPSDTEGNFGDDNTINARQLFWDD